MMHADRHIHRSPRDKPTSIPPWFSPEESEPSHPDPTGPLEMGIVRNDPPMEDLRGGGDDAVCERDVAMGAAELPCREGDLGGQRVNVESAHHQGLALLGRLP